MVQTAEPPFVYEQAWRPGELIIWDKRALHGQGGAVLHRKTEYDTVAEARIVRRTVIVGDEPY